MSLSKLIIIGIGLLFLVIPFNVTNAGQIIIQSSQGTEVITTPDRPSNETKGENWNRVYAPGQMEREHREAESRERFEKQQKAAEEKAADERYFKKQEMEAKKQEMEMKKKELEIREKEANKPPDNIIVHQDDSRRSYDSGPPPPPPPDFMIPARGGVINSRTGIFYPSKKNP